MSLIENGVNPDALAVRVSYPHMQQIKDQHASFGVMVEWASTDLSSLDCY